MKGKPKARKGAGMLAWRSRQKTGAIMSPGKFEEIERKAEAGGARNAAKVAGAAYWATVKAKYKERRKK